MMKKVVPVIVLSILMIFTVYSYTYKAEAATKATTLAELRAELKKWKQDLKNNQNQQQATKNEISSAKNSVSNKQSEIEKNRNQIAKSQAESKKLEQEIADGKKSLEKIVQTYQLAKGENVYLEYVFAATSYEELVYRYAVMEQIMEYQDDQIKTWKDKIEKNTQLKQDLEKREVTLNNQIDDLGDEIKHLGNKLEDFMDITMDIKDEISSTEELIEYYESIGCKENEDLNKCAEVAGDTGFRKPVKKGTITSYYGYRTHPVTGQKNKFHSGVDIGGNKEGTPIYSIANGMVGKIIKKASCGGNQVYVYHTIKGKKYTSAYLHLLKINVKIGDKVTNSTVIGTVGGGKGTKSWDRCSTGPHLHLGLGTGWYGSTYTSYSRWTANLVNPKDKLKLPNKGTYWYSR